ncbi:hypothetical protein CHUAL_012060 [Chamberlinius hualienensis]
MKLQRSNNLLSIVICLLAVVYSALCQCCDFHTTSCSWTGEWKTSPFSTPSLIDYPGFALTLPSPDYKFVQDDSQTETSDATYHISSQGVVISFDYFFGSPYSYIGVNRLEVSFENAATLDTLIVTSSVDPLYAKALFAFDRIGICAGSETPKEEAPGTGPCCDFDTLNCADSNRDWEWSVSIPAPIPSPGSTYLWATNDLAIAYFPYVSTTYAINDFSLNYYIENLNDRLLVEFASSFGRVSIGYLSYIKGSWETYTFFGVDCCAGFSSSICLLAIVYSGISETPKEEAPRAGTCCNFDTFNCAESSVGWQWSASLPAPPIPSPGSQFLWTSTEGSIAEFPPLSIIYPINDFSLNYYIENPGDYLTVDFISTNGIVPLGYLSYITGSWESITYSHIDCCNGYFPPSICLLAVVYSASSQCCDFSTTSCSWTGDWKTSPDYVPSTGNYPGFWSSARSIDFKFIEDSSSSELSDSTFHISSKEDIISFDYFFDSPYATASNKLEFYFENVQTGLRILIAGINTPNSNWSFGYSFVCDSSNDYCCGGVGDLPCDGRIIVTSTLDPLYHLALFAFDNIGICISGTPKEVEAAPSVGTCCDFDTVNCIDPLYSFDWEWSVSIPAPIPSPGSTFLWSTSNGAEAVFPSVTIANPLTEFSLNYYIGNLYDHILVDLVFSSTLTTVHLGYLSFSSGSWDTYTFPCSNCCDPLYPTCDAKLVVRAIISAVGNYVAIDTVVVNGGCFTAQIN